MAEGKVVFKGRQKATAEGRIFRKDDARFAAGISEEAMLHWVPCAKSIIYDNTKASEPYRAGSERLITLRSGLTTAERIEICNEPTFPAMNSAIVT